MQKISDYSNNQSSDIRDRKSESGNQGPYSTLNWLNIFIIIPTPIIGLIGTYYIPLQRQTLIFAILYYSMTALGITAGYHRLWSHRSYTASPFLQLVLALLGAGAAQGSIHWFCRGHRAHHRYVDTDLDPVNARRGFLYSHIGWLILKPATRVGYVDMMDLRRNAVVRWQHRYYIPIVIFSALVFPGVVAWWVWGDGMGGVVYAGFVRVAVLHQSTFLVNSLAHWMGTAPFDDKHTPRDHFIVSLLTMGEGYHNFHHEFPNDYRSAIKWYQYDPTKWFIRGMGLIGLAWDLQVFSQNEINKGELTMQLKMLKCRQDGVVWPEEDHKLRNMSWETFQEESNHTSLIAIGGFIHDITSFIHEHPGGPELLSCNVGKDATSAFVGGVYEHSNAAQTYLLAMKRVGVLSGGMRQIPGIHQRGSYVPPSQRLRIVDHGVVDSGGM